MESRLASKMMSSGLELGNVDAASLGCLWIFGIACILSGNLTDTKHRKLAKLQFIINFETNKFGHNKDISFLSRSDTFKCNG